jgi:hypothetical protein
MQYAGQMLPDGDAEAIGPLWVPADGALYRRFTGPHDGYFARIGWISGAAGIGLFRVPVAPGWMVLIDDNPDGADLPEDTPTAADPPTPTDPPVNVDRPYVSQAGDTLNCTMGNWTGAPTAYAYQWQKNGENIGADAASYTVLAADVGATMTCVVTATNAYGATQAPPSNPVVAA